VDCGPKHIQCNYSYAYSGFNIQVNVSELLLDICRQFTVRYTANMVPNTAHILQFTPCELWSRPYTKCLQHGIFRLQHSTKRICAAIGDITTIQCMFYCKLGAEYSATTANLSNVYCGPGHIRCIYSSAYSDLNVHLNVSALLLEISRQFNARYTANIEPNTAYIIQFTQCVLWSRKYTMYLQLLIFRQQYSSERICAAIGHTPTFRCALYCKFGVQCRAHRLDYAV
jgi:hypothetical protein